MTGAPRRLLEDPELGSALADEIADARAWDPAALEARTLTAAARGHPLGVPAGLSAGLLLAAAALGGAWWLARADDAPPQALEALAQGGAPKANPGGPAVLEAPPSPAADPAPRGETNEGAPRAPERPEAHDGDRSSAHAFPPRKTGADDATRSATRRPSRRRPASVARPGASAKTERVEDTASAERARAREDADEAPKQTTVSGEVDDRAGPTVSREAHDRDGPTAGPASSGEAQVTAIDDLAADLDDYDAGRAALEAGDHALAARRLTAYLEQHPSGRLRLEAQLDLIEALVELGRAERALTIAERLLEDPAAADRAAELVALVVELRVATGRCGEAERLARERAPGLLESARRCEDGGG